MASVFRITLCEINFQLQFCVIYVHLISRIFQLRRFGGFNGRERGKRDWVDVSVAALDYCTLELGSVLEEVSDFTVLDVAWQASYVKSSNSVL